MTRTFALVRSPALPLLCVCLCALVLFVFSPQVLAGDALEHSFFAIQSKLATLFTWIRNILFLVAGVAVIAVAASAYAGRFNIKWFVTVVISVVLIAVNGALTNYFVDTGAGAATSSTLGTAIGTPVNSPAPGSIDDALR